jgi:hypothetical protein
VDELARILAETTEQGLRQRFARALEARPHASDSVAKGRAYVAAYVAFVHHAKLLQDAATADASREQDDRSTGAHGH